MGVCVSSFPLPRTVAVGGRAPGEGCDAPRPRVNGSRSFWKKLVLVPNTSPTVPRPLNPKRLSSAAGAGIVECGAAVKNERAGGVLFFPGVQEGKERRPFFHLLQFPNQTHHRQSQEERPKGETRALGWGRRGQTRDAGDVRAAGRKARVSGFGRPHEGRVTVARGALSEAEWL